MLQQKSFCSALYIRNDQLSQVHNPSSPVLFLIAPGGNSLKKYQKLCPLPAISSSPPLQASTAAACRMLGVRVCVVILVTISGLLVHQFIPFLNTQTVPVLHNLQGQQVPIKKKIALNHFLTLLSSSLL